VSREARFELSHYQRSERAYRPFLRSFALPTMVDQEKVQATYRDGVLELRLPKLEAAKPKRIAFPQHRQLPVRRTVGALLCVLPGSQRFFAPQPSGR
jgi:hypothetical protein